MGGEAGEGSSGIPGDCRSCACTCVTLPDATANAYAATRAAREAIRRGRRRRWGEGLRQAKRAFPSTC